MRLTKVVWVAVVTLLPASWRSSRAMALRNALPRLTLLLLAEFPGETLEQGIPNKHTNPSTPACVHNALFSGLLLTGNNVCIRILCFFQLPRDLQQNEKTFKRRLPGLEVEPMNGFITECPFQCTVLIYFIVIDFLTYIFFFRSIALKFTMKLDKV